MGPDGAHRLRGIAQGSPAQIVGVGKCGFFPADGAHTHALVDAEAAAFDDALFQAPTFAAGVLKVQVGIVRAMRQDLAQRFFQVGFVQAVGGQQQVAGHGQAFEGGFA